jgi:hypothetical protein
VQCEDKKDVLQSRSRMEPHHEFGSSSEGSGCANLVIGMFKK